MNPPPRQRPPSNVLSHPSTLPLIAIPQPHARVPNLSLQPQPQVQQVHFRITIRPGAGVDPPKSVLYPHTQRPHLEMPLCTARVTHGLVGDCVGDVMGRGV